MVVKAVIELESRVSPNVLPGLTKLSVTKVDFLV
jgi:hypothetical protein